MNTKRPLSATEETRRAKREFHDALLTAHGAPLREELFAVPDALRWVAVARNRLFSDREPRQFFAATSESATKAALDAGVSRPDLFVVCESCGRRLRVVNLSSTERLMAAHRGTERCLYRSILAVSLWAGFAPLTGRGNLHYSDEQREVLDAFDNLGQERQSARAWARTPRVLAFAALRAREFVRQTPNLPSNVSALAIVANSDATHIDLDQLEQLQSADTDPAWIARAQKWSEELVLYRGFDHATDAYDNLATRAVEATLVLKP